MSPEAGLKNCMDPRKMGKSDTGIKEEEEEVSIPPSLTIVVWNPVIVSLTTAV